MSKQTTSRHSAFMRAPRRTASLDAYVGFRDTTHGADESNVPQPPVPKGGRQPNRAPFKGSGSGRVQ